MNRLPAYLLGPEVVLAVATLLLFWFCARHNSGMGRDVEIMEKFIWALPFILAPIAFATLVFPESKSWWWLCRAIVFSYLAIFVCGYRLISGLGSGAKGQDAAMIILVISGSAAIAIVSSIAGAVILSAMKPEVANWFQTHKFLGSLLTLLAMIPIGIVLGVVVTFLSTVLLAFIAGFSEP